MFFRHWLAPVLFFLFSLAWFSFFQPWGSFLDPDVFYHAKMASLVLAHGPLHAFPWLPLTTLGENFADQHFLFHVALIPFVHFFGMMRGAQIAAVFFSALLFLVLFFVMGALKVRHRFVWLALALTSRSFLARLSFAKASPLAIGWFVLGLFALIRRRPYLALLVGIGYALTHGGWPLLLVCQGLYLFGIFITVRFVEKKTWREAIRAPYWKAFFATIVGIAIGLLIHPNARNMLAFLWVQIVQIGIKAPYALVPLSNEWRALTPIMLVSYLGSLILVGCVLLLGLLFAYRRYAEPEERHRVIAGAFVILGLTVLTCLRLRLLEYLVPTAVLSFALAWTLVDPRVFFAWWRKCMINRRVKIGTYLVCGIFFATVGSDLTQTYLELRGRAKRPYDEYRGITQAIEHATRPGERVCNTRWDDFPELFALSDRETYIAGLDPTFLFAAHPELSDGYFHVTEKKDFATIYAELHDRLGCRIIVTTKNDPKTFWDTLDHATGTKLLYKDEVGRVYEINKP